MSVCTRRLRKNLDCSTTLGRLLHMHAAIVAHLASVHRRGACTDNRYGAFKTVYDGARGAATFTPGQDTMLDSFSYHNIVPHPRVFLKCAMCGGAIPTTSRLQHMIFVDTLKQPWIARCDACAQNECSRPEP